MSTKVVITGGSKGIGRYTAAKFKSYFYDVVDISRTSGYDLSQGVTEDILQIVKSARIVVLNAGKWTGPDAFKLNYEIPNLLLDYISKDQHVVVVLSNAAYENYGNDDYTTAKSGILLKCRRLQKEGYRISVVSPGTTNTDFWENSIVDNRQKCLPIEPEEIAELIFNITQLPSLVTETTILPRRKPC